MSKLIHPLTKYNNNLPKTVIFGASGFLGNAFLCAYRKTNPDCVGTVRTSLKKNEAFIEYLDLNSPNIKSMNLLKKGHQQALIFASISKLAECEKHKKSSRKINVFGTIELIKQLNDEGIRPIFISSDIVFDGNTGDYSDDSKTSPINEYGKQKAEVEEKIKDICKDNYLIIRLSKTFSLVKWDGTLLDEMAMKLASGKCLREAYDLIFCPILITDLIKSVVRIQSKGYTGVINVCGIKAWSRYEIAVLLANRMGINNKKIKKISIDELDLGCKRPKDTTMKTDKLQKIIDFEYNSMQECIFKVARNWTC